jgi:hypothetical protein
MKVWQHWTTYTIVEIMDSTLIGNAPEDQVLKCVHIGLLCVQENPVDRPMMSTINVMLSSSSSAASPGSTEAGILSYWFPVHQVRDNVSE